METEKLSQYTLYRLNHCIGNGRLWQKFNLAD